MASNSESSGQHRITLPPTMPPGADDAQAERYAQLVRQVGHHKASLMLLGVLMGEREALP